MILLFLYFFYKEYIRHYFGYFVVENDVLDHKVVIHFCFTHKTYKWAIMMYGQIDSDKVEVPLERESMKQKMGQSTKMSTWKTAKMR